MEKDFITPEMIAVILSSTISLVSIVSTAVVTILQQRNQTKTKSMEIYFEAQLEAYKNLYISVMDLERDLEDGEKRDIRGLLSAAKVAEMLSPTLTANVIDNFCAVYNEYMTELDAKGDLSEELKNEFKDAKDMLEFLMREELMRNDLSKRKYLKLLRKAYSKEIKKENEVFIEEINKFGGI